MMKRCSTLLPLQFTPCPPNSILNLHFSICASVARSYRRHVAMTAWPISRTLRPVESPSGMPKASSVQPISSRPGLKGGPCLAKGSWRGCQWASRGNSEGLRGSLPEGSKWTGAAWQSFSERLGFVSLTTARSLCTTESALMGLSPSNCPTGNTESEKRAHNLRLHIFTSTHAHNHTHSPTHTQRPAWGSKQKLQCLHTKSLFKMQEI